MYDRLFTVMSPEYACVDRRFTTKGVFALVYIFSGGGGDARHRRG